MIEGGIRLAIVEAEAISAAVNARSYRSLSISGATVRLSTATSAADEPEIPAKNMLKTVTTCARPPRRCPTSTWARRIMRWVTSAEVISSPTSRKNGIARSVSESMPWNSCPMIDWKLTGVSAVATSTPPMSAKATGTPM